MKNLFWLALIGFGIWAYSTGLFESWSAQVQIADRPVSEVTCEELVEVANGQSLRNAFGASYRVLKVYDPREVGRSPSQLTCRTGVLLDDGRETDLTVRLKEVQGERFFEFSAS